MWAFHCSGFPLCGAWALGLWASVVAAHGLSSCGSGALERRFSSCGAWALLLYGMWDLPRPGLEPVSPALAGGFLTAAPPGKSLSASLVSSMPSRAVHKQSTEIYVSPMTKHHSMTKHSGGHRKLRHM